jgi:hypothetical protein
MIWLVAYSPKPTVCEAAGALYRLKTLYLFNAVQLGDFAGESLGGSKSLVLISAKRRTPSISMVNVMAR